MNVFTIKPTIHDRQWSPRMNSVPTTQSLDPEIAEWVRDHAGKTPEVTTTIRKTPAKIVRGDYTMTIPDFEVHDVMIEDDALAVAFKLTFSDRILS